jgi:hypothetical protein
VADALSRVGSMMELAVISEVQPVWIQEILNSYVTDAEAQDMITQLLVHSPNEQGFTYIKALLEKMTRSG